MVAFYLRPVDLVFHGTAMGHFYASNDETGNTLLDLFIGTGIIAPPVTYSIDDEQYVAIMAGWGGPALNTLAGNEALLQYSNAGRILVFKLDGSKVPLPAAIAARGPFPEPPEIKASAEIIEQGRLSLCNKLRRLPRHVRQARRCCRICGACHAKNTRCLSK